MDHIKRLIADTEPDIICLQETNLKDDHTPSLTGYDHYINNRQHAVKASGGVATFVRNLHHSEHININSNLEAVACKVWLPEPITICNIYIPPDHRTEYTQVAEIIRQLQPPFIILGDFNAHSKIWSPEKPNNRGNILENLFLATNLTLLNTPGVPTHFCSASGKFTTIDLSISDPKTATDIQWEALDSLYDSDHFPLLIKKPNKNSENTETSNQWNINEKTSWLSYKDFVDEKVKECHLKNNIDDTVEEFSTLIIQAAEKHIGRKKYNQHHSPVPWWSQECQEAIKNTKRALNRLRKHKTETNLIEFKKLRAISRRIIKEKKQASWKEYVSTLRSDTPPNQVWDKIRKLKGINKCFQIAALEGEDGTITTTKQDISEILAVSFYNKSSDTNYSKNFLDRKKRIEIEEPLVIEDDCHPINDIFSLEELKYALTTSRNSASGPDEIPFALIKNLPESALNYLLQIYNFIWTSHTFPRIWKKSIIIPILKHDKNKTKSSSYRPISLTCTLCKLLEKMINKRLTWRLEQENRITKYQNGFRKNHSTIDSHIQLHTEILDTFVNKQELIAVFFDIEKAFDTVWRHRILSQLKKWDIQGNILHFLNNFLLNRTAQVKINGTVSKTINLENGVPQGSVMSATLFIIAIDEIADTLQNPVKMSLFADDIVIFTRGAGIHTVCGLIQDNITRMTQWSDDNGFQFSAEKSKLMRFTRKTRLQKLPTINIKGNHILEVPEHTFLGLTYDHKLTWVPHIKALKADCIRRLNLLKMVAHQHWGADEATLKRMYNALIKSKMNYGSIIYSSATKSTLQMLNTVQHSALRIILGAFRTSPAESLYREGNDPPLWLRTEEQILTYAAKLSYHPHRPTHDTLFQNKYSSTYESKPHTPLPLHRKLKQLDTNLISLTPHTENTYPIPPWKLKHFTIDLSLHNENKADIPSHILKTRFYENLNRYTPKNVIYTDASKSRDGVGSAVILPNAIQRYKLPQHCCILTGELYALLQAVKEAVKLPDQTIICSDSLSSIQLIKQPYTDNQLAKQIQHIYTESDKNLILMWTPAHCGISGNQKADTAAKDAASDKNLNITHIQLPYDTINYYKTMYQQKWQTHWDLQDTKLHEIEPHIHSKTAQFLTRREEVITRRLRIGHTLLTHKYLLEKLEKPQCNLCEVPITVKHILVECPKYEQPRMESELPNNLADILNYNKDSVQRLTKFLKSANLWQQI